MRLVSLEFLDIGDCLVPVQCQMSVDQIDFPAGSHAELHCSSNSISSRVNSWQWYQNSRLLPGKTDRYIISNISREDMGMYQCCYITNPSDSNACCAQTQVRVISKFDFFLS